MKQSFSPWPHQDGCGGNQAQALWRRQARSPAEKQSLLSRCSRRWLRQRHRLRRQHQRTPHHRIRSGVVLRTLTDEEKEARDRALAGSRVREAEERKQQEEELIRRKASRTSAMRIEREAAAKRKAEDDARHRSEEEGRRKAEEAAKKLDSETSCREADEEEEAAAARSAARGQRRRCSQAQRIEVPAPTRTKADMRQAPWPAHRRQCAVG